MAYLASDALHWCGLLQAVVNVVLRRKCGRSTALRQAVFGNHLRVTKLGPAQLIHLNRILQRSDVLRMLSALTCRPTGKRAERNGLLRWM